MKEYVLYSDQRNSNGTSSYDGFMTYNFGTYQIDSMDSPFAIDAGVTVDPTLVVYDSLSRSNVLAMLEGSEVNNTNAALIRSDVENDNLFGSGQIDETMFEKPDYALAGLWNNGTIDNLVEGAKEIFNNLVETLQQYWLYVLIALGIITIIVLYILGVVTFKM